MDRFWIIWPQKIADKHRWLFQWTSLLDVETKTTFRKKIEVLLDLSKSQLLIAPNRKHTTWPRNKEELDKLIKTSLYLIEEAVKDIFAELSIPFIPATIVLFSWKTKTWCGDAFSGIWPFYCPADKNIYLDPQFFIDILEHYPDAEDFIVFYVLAHEYAHYLQNIINDTTKAVLIWTWERIQASNILELQEILRYSLPKRYHNKISQTIELFADYTAGIITRYANLRHPFLEENDIIEGLETALYIGDDMLQYRRRERIKPHTFTHWVGEQRAAAFAEWLRYWNLNVLNIKNFLDIITRQIQTPRQEVILFNV